MTKLICKSYRPLQMQLSSKIVAHIQGQYSKAKQQSTA